MPLLSLHLTLVSKQAKALHKIQILSSTELDLLSTEKDICFCLHLAGNYDDLYVIFQAKESVATTQTYAFTYNLAKRLYCSIN